jgi:hypothetical protein
VNPANTRRRFNTSNPRCRVQTSTTPRGPSRKSPIHKDRSATHYWPMTGTLKPDPHRRHLQTQKFNIDAGLRGPEQVQPYFCRATPYRLAQSRPGSTLLPFPATHHTPHRSGGTSVAVRYTPITQPHRSECLLCIWCQLIMTPFSCYVDLVSQIQSLYLTRLIVYSFMLEGSSIPLSTSTISFYCNF